MPGSLLVPSLVCLSLLPILPTQGCETPLHWVPFKVKAPYTTLLNHEYCPSWFTRNFFTRRTVSTSIKVPRDLPLPLICGFCVQKGSELEPNITVSAGGEAIPMRFVRNKNNDVLHSVGSHKCRITYAISGPIERSGTYKCHVGFGSRSFQETVDYSVTDPDVSKSEEEMNVGGSRVELRCPAHPTDTTAPLLHVWYYPLADRPTVAAPTANPLVEFRLANSEPLIVACATYSLDSADKVAIKTFKVRKAGSAARRITSPRREPESRQETATSGWNKEQHYGAFGEVADDASVYSSASEDGESSAAYTALIAVVCVMCAVLTVVAGIFGYRKWQEGRTRLHGPI